MIMSTSTWPEASPPVTGPGSNPIFADCTTVVLQPGAPRLGRDEEATVTVPTSPVPGSGYTGELRATRAEVGLLHTELAGLLDRVHRLEQRGDTVRPVPTAAPRRPTPGPGRRRTRDPRSPRLPRGPGPPRCRRPP